MKPIGYVFTCLLAMFFNSCNDAGYISSEESNHETHQEILSRINTYYQDFSDRDWIAFESHFWDKAIIATVWSPDPNDSDQLYTQTTKEFVDQADLGPGSKPIFEEKMTKHQIEQEGNVAMVWAHYDAKFGDEGKVDEWSGIDAFTLLRHNGIWKIIAIGFASVE